MAAWRDSTIVAICRYNKHLKRCCQPAVSWKPTIFWWDQMRGLPFWQAITIAQLLQFYSQLRISRCFFKDIGWQHSWLKLMHSWNVEHNRSEKPSTRLCKIPWQLAIVVVSRDSQQTCLVDTLMSFCLHKSCIWPAETWRGLCYLSLGTFSALHALQGRCDTYEAAESCSEVALSLASWLSLSQHCRQNV